MNHFSPLLSAIGKSGAERAGVFRCVGIPPNRKRILEQICKQETRTERKARSILLVKGGYMMEHCSFDGFVLSPCGWVREWPAFNEQTEN